MKLIYVTGCTCDTLNIDGKETIDMKINELKSHLHTIIDKIEDTADLQNILMNIAETQGEYEDLGHCEQCGDYIFQYTLEF